MFVTIEQNINFKKNRLKIKELPERKIGEKKSKIGSSLAGRLADEMRVNFKFLKFIIDQFFLLFAAFIKVTALLEQ